MIVRNKKTGEIKECAVVPIFDGYVNEYKVFEKSDSLAELNEEWEDYEEPKDIWWLDNEGYVNHAISEDDNFEKNREIGNYFKTEEEAKKAVDRLKVITRLKNKGFKFDGYDVANRGGDNVICGQVYFKAGNYDKEEIDNDLDLLFGGEE